SIPTGSFTDENGFQRRKNMPSPRRMPPVMPGIWPGRHSMALPQLATYERLAADESSKSSLGHIKSRTGGYGLASPAGAPGSFHIDHRLFSSMYGNNTIG